MQIEPELTLAEAKEALIQGDSSVKIPNVESYTFNTEEDLKDRERFLQNVKVATVDKEREWNGFRIRLSMKNIKLLVDELGPDRFVNCLFDFRDNTILSLRAIHLFEEFNTKDLKKKPEIFTPRLVNLCCFMSVNRIYIEFADIPYIYVKKMFPKK